MSTRTRPRFVRDVLTAIETTLNAAGIEDANHDAVTFYRGLSDRSIEKLNRGIQEQRPAFVKCMGISFPETNIGELALRLLIGIFFFRDIGQQEDDELLTWDTMVATCTAVGEELTSASEVNGAGGLFGLASGVNRVVEIEPAISMELLASGDPNSESAEDSDEIQGIYQFAVICRMNLIGQVDTI